jgi:cytochrome P450
LKAKHEKDRSAPPGEGAFVEDGRLIIIAGSDTTASTLASAIYFLCQSPEKAERLRNELKKVFPNGEADWSIEKLKEVPYLEGVIDETLRLKPAIPSGVPRVTPEAGLQIDDVFIPGDTNVIVPTHTIQRDSRYFVDPNSFVPERWMEEKAEMVIDRSAYAPFSQGNPTLSDSSLIQADDYNQVYTAASGRISHLCSSEGSSRVL